MPSFPVDLLKKACDIFLRHAYADGCPAELAPDAMFPRGASDVLCISEAAKGRVRRIDGPRPGYSIRLGCAAFPFLRMTIQHFDNDGSPLWLCGVDTHDTWHHANHPDAAAWLAVQVANRELKSRIERAWEDAGIYTQNRLLRVELQPAG
jgi:hypothetical protein